MERYKIKSMDGTCVAEVTPTAGDKIRARKELRRQFPEGSAMGDMYVFFAFYAAKRTGVAGADGFEDPVEWADTIADVDIDLGEPDPASAEGEGGATPAE